MDGEDVLLPRYVPRERPPVRPPRQRDVQVVVGEEAVVTMGPFCRLCGPHGTSIRTTGMMGPGKVLLRRVKKNGGRMSRSTYAKSAGLILIAVVLAVEGYLLYRYYDRYYVEAPAGATMRETREATVWETTMLGPRSPEATVTPEDRFEGRRVSHRATGRNILGNSTYLDLSAETRDNDAVILIEDARDPGGGSYDEHELGVWYDANQGGRWAIFNQDRRFMREGSDFDVILLEGPDRLVHRSGPNNTAANATLIDDPLTNGRPDAVLGVTQNWNPGGVGGVYNDHPVGVRYDPGADGWEIYNKDNAAMPGGAAFNVSVSGASP